MKKVDLLARAIIDLKQVEPNVARMVEDELFLDAAAYHLQQGIEKIMKYVINSNGEKFNKTHKILELCQSMDGYNIRYPEWLYENAELLTSYAEDTRYSDDLVGNKRKVLELLDLAFSYASAVKQEEEQIQDDYDAAGIGKTSADNKPSTPNDYTKIGGYNVADYKEAPHIYLDENSSDA